MLAETVIWAGNGGWVGGGAAAEPECGLVCDHVSVSSPAVNTGAALGAFRRGNGGTRGVFAGAFQIPRGRWQSMISGARELGLQPIDADSPEIDAVPCM
ncbi:hypothetical protein Landi51_02194 [Colletotrichum acutatum]